MITPDPGPLRQRIRQSLGLDGWPLVVLALLGLPLVAAADPGAPVADHSNAEPPRTTAPAEESGGQIPSDLPALDPSTRWLQEVRAQREAWEARRKAARESFGARRSGAGPWGATQQAWEEEVERRREVRRQQREQERELFRSLGPSEPPPPWLEGIGRPGGPPGDPLTTDHPSRAVPQPQVPGVVYPPRAPSSGPYSPQDWDNLWYYRGY